MDKQRPYKVLDVAQVVLDYYRKNNKLITNLGLNKVLFFIQWYFLKNEYGPCFEDEIEAWQYGPVVPNLYNRCKDHLSSPIIYEIGNSNNISNEYKQEIEQNILSKLIKYQDWQLVDMTHKKGGCWDRTKLYYQQINLNDIKNDNTIEILNNNI